MLVGIISDTHDNLPAVEAAALMMRRRNVGLVLHAGDIIAPFVAPVLAKAGARVIAVFGNNDGERAGLRRRFREIGEVRGDVAEVELEGRKTILYHGTEPAFADALISSGKYHLVVLGHTHEPRVERVGGTLVVNPGEGCGYLTGRRTVALLETGAMAADIITL